MKTRQGFVSNSSSSSFVVWFPYKIDSRDDLERAIFPNGKHNIHGMWSGDTITADQCLDELWHQVQNPDTWRVKEILEHTVYAQDDVFKEQQKAIDAIKKDRNAVTNFHRVLLRLKIDDQNWYYSAFYKHYDKHISGIETAMIRRLQSRSTDVPYSFEFEDHNPLEAVLENGNQFDHLKHHKESHH